MNTLLEILTLSAKHLELKGIANPRREAEELISMVLNIKRLELYMQFDRPMTDAELDKCRAALNRRAKREPVQYISGYVPFYDCRIAVNKSVLIPRQETEILVDKIAAFLESQALEGKALWDICTGSGCIGIALKKKFPLLKVVLSDLSPEALQVAKENALQNQVDVEIYEGDLLRPFKGKKADFVVSNPPYVKEGDYESLDLEVKHEPKSALIGGATGLEFYEALSEALPAHLNRGASVFFEIGKDQGAFLLNLFSKPIWSSPKVEKDWAGHDRFFYTSLSPC